MLNNKRIEVLISTKNRNIDGIPIDPELDALLEYIHDSTKIKTDFVKKIDEEVTKINEDPVKLEAIMRYNLHIEDIKEDSFAKGEAKGSYQKSLDIAKKMLLKGMDDDSIMELTGLTHEQLHQLKS